MGLSSLFGGGNANKAAKRAAEAQVKSTRLGVDELRRQFDATQANLLPFIEAGQGVVGDVTSAGTVGGLNERLAAIMGGSQFDALVDEREREVQNHLARSGLRRSGAGIKAAAAIPTDLALAIEQVLFGRQANLMGSGQNAAAGLGAIGANTSGGVADLFSQMGQARGNSILQAQQADAKAAENTVNTALTAAAIFFSDERLKENLQPIGEISGLTLYRWEWKPQFKYLIGAEMSIGFSAQEVEEQYPEYVHEVNGIKAINYPALTERLQ
ncbi:MAG: tail fiber domain-containing protein [Candidatus Thiodiazotropha sp.]